MKTDEKGGPVQWQKTIIQGFADVLRSAVKIALILDGIMLAVFSLWFVAKFLWRLHEWMNKSFLGDSWL